MTRLAYRRLYMKNDKLSCQCPFLLHVVDKVVSYIVAAKGMQWIIALDNVSVKNVRLL